MKNINFEKVFKYGFIASIVMICIGAFLKMRTLVASFELIALLCGVLVAGVIIMDLIGWGKANTFKSKGKKKL